jgi:hypothetical protein
MTLKINDTSRCAAAVAARAVGLAVRGARDEPVRRAGFRSDIDLGRVRQASTELAGTADHLDRIAAATKPGACLVPWAYALNMATPWPARARRRGAGRQGAAGGGLAIAAACASARASAWN